MKTSQIAKNTIQNGFCTIIDDSLASLRRLDYISADTREKINNILQQEVKWDE